jgi:eukaryotic-like serine/threonine-protein kinase
VIFTSDRSGNMDLWEISTKSGVLRRITDDPATDWDPAFTPDGKHIVWSSNRSGGFEIWIADTDGSNARQVTKDGLNAQNPMGTRDGWIVYWTPIQPKEAIWKIRQDGTQATRLVEQDAALPEVSPDGLFLAYTLRSSDGVRVVRMADAAAALFTISGVFQKRWIMEGRAIAFIGQDEGGKSGVFVQDFIPGQDTRKTRRKLGGFDPERQTETFGISPDGARMTISLREQTSSLMIVEVPGVAPPRRAR